MKIIWDEEGESRQWEWALTWREVWVVVDIMEGVDKDGEDDEEDIDMVVSVDDGNRKLREEEEWVWREEEWRGRRCEETN